MMFSIWEVGSEKVILWDLVCRCKNDAHDVHDNAFAIYIYVYIRADSNLSEYNFEGMRQKMLLLCCWTYKDYAKTMKLSSIMHKMSC